MREAVPKKGFPFRHDVGAGLNPPLLDTRRTVLCRLATGHWPLVTADWPLPMRLEGDCYETIQNFGFNRNPVCQRQLWVDSSAHGAEAHLHTRP